jgi:predicted secreted protein
MWACTALLLLVAMCADAEVISSFRAYVISVDVAANSVKLKYTDEETPTNWKETTATWNKDTEWVRADKEIWKQEPATAELAKQLKKDAKVYVRVVDPERKGARLERLSTIPPDSTVP